jgi:hypothetical protein
MNVGSPTMAGVEMPMERASHVAAGEDWRVELYGFCCE